MMQSNVISKLKRWYYNLPIAYKINSISIGSIFIFILLIYIANKTSSEILIKRTVENSVQNLELVNQSLTSMLDNAETLSNTILANSFVQKYLNEVKNIGSNDPTMYDLQYIIRGIFDNSIEPRRIVSSIAIFNTKQNIVTSGKVNTPVFQGNMEIYNRTEKQLRERWNAIIWEDLHTVQYETDNANADCISMIRNIISSSNGSIIGYLLMDINEQNISKIYSGIKYGETGRYIIINRDGRVVSSLNKSELNESVSGYPYFQWVVNHDREGKIFDISGKKYLVSSSNFNRMGWIVLGIVPLDELTGDNVKVTKFIYFTGLICILISILLSYLLANTISKPIIKLSRLMVNAGVGQFDIRIEEQGHDEVGHLTRSFNRMLGHISSLMQEVYTEQKKKREYELLALQAQINPHFLYNTLESICSLIRLNWSEDALELIQTLGKFYRMVINKGDSIISVEQEIEIIKQYLTIQKIRYREHLEYEIEIDHEVLDRKIIKLSVQPIVENAIYHGIKKKGDKGKISISGKIEGGYVIVSVADDGVGMSPETVKQLLTDSEERRKLSFGLRSVDERIKLHFGDEYGIAIQSKPGQGTRIDILLPSEFVS